MKKFKYLLALLIPFLCFFFLSKDTFATSVVHTYNANNYTSADTICSDYKTCSQDYGYLIIESSSDFGTSGSAAFLNIGVCTTDCVGDTLAYAASYQSRQLFSYSDKLVISLDKVTYVNKSVLASAPSSSPDWFIKITLTSDNPFESSCPEPPEPDCPDPEENSQYINVVLDSFWKYHTAFAGAVVAIIVIFLVYRLIKGVMR